MPLRTTVKASNITNLSDARYCAGMGVEMIGFSMDATSESYVSVQKLNEIRAWVAGVQIVGQTESADLAEVEALVAAYLPDVLQVSHADIVQRLDKKIPAIYKVEIDSLPPDDLDDLLRLVQGRVEYILLESKKSEPLNQDWIDFLGLIAAEHPILLGFGINAANVLEMVDKIPLKGIALAGSQELRPGYNDFGALMDILEMLEED